MADSVPIEADKHELGVEKLKFSPLADNPALVLPVEIGFNGTPVPDRVFCWREFFHVRKNTCNSGRFTDREGCNEELILFLVYPVRTAATQPHLTSRISIVLAQASLRTRLAPVDQVLL